MEIEKNSFKSPLAKAKSYGPSHNGTSTWWAQRVSAVALIPLCILFVIFLINVFTSGGLDVVLFSFNSPFLVIALSLFIGTGLYHGAIGIKEIIEDYVYSNKVKLFLIIFVKLFSLITAVAGICAVLVLHLSTFNFN